MKFEILLDVAHFQISYFTFQISHWSCFFKKRCKNTFISETAKLWCIFLQNFLCNHESKRSRC